MAIEMTSEPQVFDTRKLLQNAARQAKDRRFQDLLIIDVDCHHYESESFGEIAKYIENPVIRHQALSRTGRVTHASMFPAQIVGGNQDVSGRVTRYRLRRLEQTDPAIPRDVQLVHRYMDQMGIDYTVLFPTPMLNIGLHPQVQVEVELCRAYARWMTEELLPHSKRIKSMLCLPFNDPDESIRMIEEFGHRPGVVGFMVTSVRTLPVHHNRYIPIYHALWERSMPIAFHAGYDWTSSAFQQMDNFTSVHALSFPFYNMVHIANVVTHGILERFPGLKILWIEGGLAYVTFLMQRFDNEYMMRSSETPLLKQLPSDYMRQMYWSSQPMERVNNEGMLAETFKMLKAETQLLYSSDYPHWDFDVPSVIYDLPFLSEAAKRRILGENSRELFNITG